MRGRNLIMERVCQFLKDANVYFLATVDGIQPRVRPFGTAHVGKIKMYQNKSQKIQR